MNKILKNLVLSAFVVAPFALTGCAPECVDVSDCAEKAQAQGKEFTCVSGKCTAGSPFFDGGLFGGGGGTTGGGGGGGSTGGGGGVTGGGGGAMGGGAGGGDADAGEDAGEDAGMDLDAGSDAGIDEDAGVDVDAGFDAGLDVDAGIDAGIDVDAGFDAGIDAGVSDSGVPTIDIAQARGNADAGLMNPVTISGAIVTYVRPSFGTETAGFFVQASASGPAIFVFVDPTTLTPAPQVGDSVAFTAIAYSTLNGLAQITAVVNWQRLSTGASVSSFTQDLTASSTVNMDLNNLESELISIRGVLDAGFTNAGAPFVGAFLATSASPSANVRFRVPQSLVDSADLERGCDLTVGPTPMWRLTIQAQVSAWTANDFVINSCPAPTVISAAATSPTSVTITFTRQLDPGSVLMNGSQFTFDNGLIASAAVVTGRTVTLTTSAQTGNTAYLLTVANTVTDVRATPVGTPNTATFVGYLVPAVVRINEVNANIASGCDLIELRVVSGGSMSGYYLRERDTGTLVTFSNFIVAKNDIIVVHMNLPSTTCNPGGALLETLGPNQQPAATFARNYNTAFDWYSTDIGLTATDNVITLYNNLDLIMDAVFIDDDVAGASGVASATETQAATVAAANQWQMIGGGVPTGGFVDDNFRLHAVTNSIMTGTTNTGATLQRVDNTDDNDRADWNSPTSLAHSWGLINAGQTPFP